MAKAKIKSARNRNTVKLSLTLKEAATLQILLENVIYDGQGPNKRLNRILDVLLDMNDDNYQIDEAIYAIEKEFPNYELEIVDYKDRGLGFVGADYDQRNLDVLLKQSFVKPEVEEIPEFTKVAEGMGYMDKNPIPVEESVVFLDKDCRMNEEV